MPYAYEKTPCPMHMKTPYAYEDAMPYDSSARVPTPRAMATQPTHAPWLARVRRLRAMTGPCAKATCHD